MSTETTQAETVRQLIAAADFEAVARAQLERERTALREADVDDDGVDSGIKPIREVLAPAELQGEIAAAAVEEDDGLADRLAAYHRESALDPSDQFRLYQACRGELLDIAVSLGPSEQSEGGERRRVLRRVRQLVDKLERTAVETVTGRAGERTDDADPDGRGRSSGAGGQTDETPAGAELAATLSEEVAPAVEDFRTATDDISRNASSIAESADDQSRTVKELYAEVNELREMIESISDGTAEADALGDEAAGIVQESKATSEEIVASVDRIDEAHQDLQERYELLQAEIDEIVELTGAVRDIADQTNMLALNASIEAARVSEDGSGFAVVADEVKQLAEEAQERADDIEEAITAALEAAEMTETELQTVETEVSTTRTAASENIDRMSGAVEALDDVTQKMSRIADRADAQSTSTGEMQGLIETAAEQASSVSSDVRTVSSSAEELAALATEVGETIERARRETTNRTAFTTRSQANTDG